jgi:hypothetical protein
VLPAKHDIRDVFIEAGNLPVGEYLYISALFSAQIDIIALCPYRIEMFSLSARRAKILAAPMKGSGSSTVTR